jgi:6-phosphofructokinase 1
MMLKTARCQEFKTPEGRKVAYDTLVKEGIDALVVIGGDGTLTGARIFATEYNYPIVGLPGTIDNDLYGTDTTIGYDTALNTIMDAVDKIRDTATSHERLFFIEVMGRDAGFLALNGAIATGAEAAIIPEISTEVDQLEELIKNGFRKSKNSSIVLVLKISPVVCLVLLTCSKRVNQKNQLFWRKFQARFPSVKKPKVNVVW